MSLLPLLSSSSDAKSRTRIDPSTKSKHDLVSRFLQGYQVFNLMEGHQSLDPLLWESILEDSKISGILGGWDICIHEKRQLDHQMLFLYQSKF
jgi:hypothetical protein